MLTVLKPSSLAPCKLPLVAQLLQKKLFMCHSVFILHQLTALTPYLVEFEKICTVQPRIARQQHINICPARQGTLFNQNQILQSASDFGYIFLLYLSFFPVERQS
jgi:hypothetical protein